MTSSIKFILTLFAGVSVARAALNDWSIPCSTGVCYYDLPGSQNDDSTPSGSLKIWGDPDAISDITTAAGWEIIACDPNASEQSIRLVCANDTGICEHLFGGAGPEGKIVRLPESCGKGPFARIASAWVPEDQSVPESVARRMVRRDGQQSTVNALQLDQNFSAIDPSTSGPVGFQVQAANVPGADKVALTPSRRSSRFHGRGIKDFLTGALNDLNISINKTSAPIPIDFNKNASLLSDTIDCGPATADVNIDGGAKVHAVVTFGLAAEGRLVPPSLSSFGLTSQFTADLTGILSLKANVGGTLSSGKIPLASVGIPGLDVPGVFSIGPTLEVNAEATASLDVGVDMDIQVNYHVEKAHMTFPPQSGSKSNAPTTLSDSPLSVTLSPSVNATGKLEAHLIPSINFGISAIGGAAEAQIFVELDSSASMQLTLGASTDPISIKGLPTKSKQPLSSTIHPTSTPAPTISHKGQPFRRQSTRQIYEKPVINRDLAANLEGCFEIDTGININVGADAQFFDLFDPSTKINLFTKNFQLFQKCFGGTKSRRNTKILEQNLPSMSSSLGARAAGLSCLDSSISDDSSPISIVDKIVSAATARVL